MIGKTQIHVAAELDADGKVSARVKGICPYGSGDNERQATVSVEITDEKALAAIGKALEKAIETSIVAEPANEKKGQDEITAVAGEYVSNEARNHAVESAYVATKKKEKLG